MAAHGRRISNPAKNLRMNKPRMLVACEFSGIVRNAFSAQGWNAWSCDLLPTEQPVNHIQGDVVPHLYGWDLIIAHPPCTNLAVSGARYFKRKWADGSIQKSIDFFLKFACAPCSHIAIENPIGLMSRFLRKPEQIIQPWQFGHPESKATCLWLKGLPPLTPTKVLPLPEIGRWENQTASGQNRLPPSQDRWKIRSRTYPGIADAMAAQWTNHIKSLTRGVIHG